MFTVHYMLSYITLALGKSAPVFLKSFAAHGESKVVFDRIFGPLYSKRKLTMPKEKAAKKYREHGQNKVYQQGIL